MTVLNFSNCFLECFWEEELEDGNPESEHCRYEILWMVFREDGWCYLFFYKAFYAPPSKL